MGLVPKRRTNASGMTGQGFVDWVEKTENRLSALEHGVEALETSLLETRANLLKLKDQVRRLATLAKEIR